MSCPIREQLSGATVLITGGAGLIGSHVRDLLRHAGAKVTVLDNLSACDPETQAVTGADPGESGLIAGDVSDEDLVADLAARSDYVIHAAAHSTVAGCISDPGTAFRSNIEGTQAVLRAAAAARRVRRLVFLSSAQVYGHGPGNDTVQAFTEEQPASPLNPYASAKAWGEWQTRFVLGAAGTDFTILRPFSVYGERQIPKPRACSWVIAQFAMYSMIGDPLPLLNAGAQVRDFLHVSDAAAGICRALTAVGASGQTLNLGTGRATSVRQVAEMVRAHFPGTRMIDGPRQAHDPLGSRADVTRMAQALAWAPQITVADGIARYVSWLRATPRAIPSWLRAEGDRVAAWTTPSARTTTP